MMCVCLKMMAELPLLDILIGTIMKIQRIHWDIFRENHLATRCLFILENTDEVFSCCLLICFHETWGFEREKRGI